MKITLQNIGIVKNSTIQLDGLTVITGQNNSGKTTVGKVIYSLLDAVANIQNKARNDKIHYVQKKIEEVGTSLEMFGYVRRVDRDIIANFFGKDSVFYSLLSGNYRRELPRLELEKFAFTLQEELSKINFDILAKDSDFLKYYVRIVSTSDNSKAVIGKLKEQVEKALAILESLFIDLSRDVYLIDYARECVSQTLRVEFSNQIQPVIKSVKKSKIELSDSGSTFFNFEIMDNKVVNNGKPIFVSSPYAKIYFVDDPFIIDSLPQRRYSREQDVENLDSLLNIARILTHENKLRFALRSTKTPTVFEETVLNNSLASIREQINHVIPGEFEFSSEGEFYVQDGNKLKVSNLATGSKMFSIIKILLEKGELDKNTMLILDEPEAHLHPSWQNKFAEIIVLLVKELNVNILLTTHSSNFMLAIDAYMRKHNITEKTNFYQTNLLNDKFVEYQCVNDDMGRIYTDFMQYLSEVKVLRDTFTEE